MNRDNSLRKELRTRNRAIVKVVLEGEKVPVVAGQWRISNTRCHELVHSVCKALDPELYRSLRPSGRYRAPLSALREHVDAFMESMEDDGELTRDSSIWRVRAIPKMTVNALLAAGIHTVGDLERCGPNELLRIPVVGKETLRRIQGALRLIGS